MATTRGVTSPAPSHSPTPSVRPPGDRQFPAGGELARSPSPASPGPVVERAAAGARPFTLVPEVGSGLGSTTSRGTAGGEARVGAGGRLRSLRRRGKFRPVCRWHPSHEGAPEECRGRSPSLVVAARPDVSCCMIFLGLIGGVISRMLMQLSAALEKGASEFTGGRRKLLKSLIVVLKACGAFSSWPRGVAGEARGIQLEGGTEGVIAEGLNLERREGC